MLVKIYWSVWGFFALAFLVLFATNNLTMVSLVGLGFVAFGLIFMGMMAVLPTMVAQPIAPKTAKVKPVAIQTTRETPATTFHIFKSA